MESERDREGGERAVVEREEREKKDEREICCKKVN